MFKIIGVDGLEYGPVTGEQIHKWIAEGRANSETRILPEGREDWARLDELPQFADALGIRPAPAPGTRPRPVPALQRHAPPPALPAPSPTPAVPSVDLAAVAEPYITRGTEVDIGRCIERGWQIVRDNFWLTVGANALLGLLFLSFAALPLIGGVAALLLHGPVQGGVSYLFLKLARSEEAGLDDAFHGLTKSFLPLMLAGLVMGVLLPVAFCALIVPFIYLNVAWGFTFFLVVDKKLDFWPAMEVSRRVVTHNWFLLLGVMIVFWIVRASGVLACFVGLFVTTAIVQAAYAVAYEDLFGTRPAKAA